jgi:hypothetical protein
MTAGNTGLPTQIRSGDIMIMDPDRRCLIFSRPSPNRATFELRFDNDRKYYWGPELPDIFDKIAGFIAALNGFRLEPYTNLGATPAYRFIDR